MKILLPQPGDPNRLDPLEWFLWILWAGFWWSLACIAIITHRLSLQSRSGIVRWMGEDAVWAGYVLIAVGGWSLWRLVRLHRYRKMIRAGLIAAWVIGGIMYFGLID